MTTYCTTYPDVLLMTDGYREGYGTIVPTVESRLPEHASDVFRYKLRHDNVAVLRWEAPAHMTIEYISLPEAGVQG